MKNNAKFLVNFTLITLFFWGSDFNVTLIIVEDYFAGGREQEKVSFAPRNFCCEAKSFG